MGFPRQEYWCGLPLSSPIIAYSEPFFFFLMKSQYACLPVQMTTAERRVKWELLGSTSQTYQTSTHFIVIKQKKIVAPSLLI